MISEIDLCWMAGVLDSVGGISKRNDAAIISVAFSLTRRPEVSRELSKMLGNQETGSMMSLGYQKRGCLEHCPSNHIHVFPEAEMRRLAINGSRAFIFLSAVERFMRARREEALETIDFYLRRCSDIPSSRRVSTTRMMESLGWPIPSWEKS